MHFIATNQSNVPYKVKFALILKHKNTDTKISSVNQETTLVIGLSQAFLFCEYWVDTIPAHSLE